MNFLFSIYTHTTYIQFHSNCVLRFSRVCKLPPPFWCVIKEKYNLVNKWIIVYTGFCQYNNCLCAHCIRIYLSFLFLSHPKLIWSNNLSPFMAANYILIMLLYRIISCVLWGLNARSRKRWNLFYFIMAYMCQ